MVRFLAALLGLMMVSAVGAIDFQVGLDPTQEIPSPVLGGAMPAGMATVSVDTLTGNVSVNGTFDGLTSNAAAAHLHGLAPVGSTAGVLFGLGTVTPSTSGTLSGNGMLSPDELNGLLNGETYINLHTANNGPGEIRGQVVDSDILVYRIGLDATQETPPPNVAGFNPLGAATVVVDTSTGAIEISGSYDGMTSEVVGSHLHGLAGPGSTAGVLLGLSHTGGTSGTFSGTGTLSPIHLAGLLAGDTYINVHTMMNGPGEIRGQVVPEPAIASVWVLVTWGLLRRRGL